MTEIHKERPFEEAIEAHLLADGWLKGTPTAFQRDLALDPAHLFAFIEATQKGLWSALRVQHGAGLDQAVLDTLVKTLDSRGTLNVLRHGLKFYGKKLDLAYFRPAHGLNPDILAKYEKKKNPYYSTASL
jgi:type I restriction enzyme R subunit